MLTTCLVVFAENESLQQAPEAQALHVVKLHIHFLLLLPFLVQFPSWMQKPVLRLQTFPFVPPKEYHGDFSPHRNQHLPAWEP